MIKTFTLISFLLVFLYLPAQIKKGGNLLGGHLFYTESSLDRLAEEQDFKFAVFGISYGRALSDLTILGIHASSSPISKHVSNSTAGTFTTTSTGFGIAPYFRKYKVLGKGFFIYGEGTARFGVSRNKRTFDYTASPMTKSDHKSWSAGLAITPGLAYQLFRKFHLQVSVPDIFNAEYQESEVESNDPTYVSGTDQSFSIGSRLSNITQLGNLSIGFYFIF